MSLSLPTPILLGSAPLTFSELGDWLLGFRIPGACIQGLKFWAIQALDAFLFILHRWALAAVFRLISSGLQVFPCLSPWGISWGGSLSVPGILRGLGVELVSVQAPTLNGNQGGQGKVPWLQVQGFWVRRLAQPRDFKWLLQSHTGGVLNRQFKPTCRKEVPDLQDEHSIHRWGTWDTWPWVTQWESGRGWPRSRPADPWPIAYSKQRDGIYWGLKGKGVWGTAGREDGPGSRGLSDTEWQDLQEALLTLAWLMCNTQYLLCLPALILRTVCCSKLWLWMVRA